MTKSTTQSRTSTSTPLYWYIHIYGKYSVVYIVSTYSNIIIIIYSICNQSIYRDVLMQNLSLSQNFVGEAHAGHNNIMILYNS